MQGPAPDNVLRELQISFKSVHFRRSYSRTREHLPCNIWRGSTKTCLEQLNKSPRDVLLVMGDFRAKVGRRQPSAFCNVIRGWAVWLRRNEWSRWAARRLLLRARVGSSQYHVQTKFKVAVYLELSLGDTRNQINYVSNAQGWKQAWWIVAHIQEQTATQIISCSWWRWKSG